MVWLIFFFVLIALPLIAMQLFRVSWRSQFQQFRAIAECPITTSGTVVRKRKFTSVTYRYKDFSGCEHEATTDVLREEWHSYEDGGAIPVVYCRDTPELSLPFARYQRATAAMDNP